jgi:diguanylate cyclase (GGDEF)-like protein
LSWYHDQSRLLWSAAAIILTVVALGPTAPESVFMQRAVVIALPLIFSLLAILKEHGILARNGLLKAAIVAALPAGLFLLADRIPITQVDGVAWPAALQIAFAIGTIILLTLVFTRRTKVEQGLFWAVVAMFLAMNQQGAPVGGPTPDSLTIYAGTAGIILVFAVLEHGYDIAYRDELTGLAGRRAFNNVMEQLGGRYAFAMCDVDHFKRFNDTYGHDAGDQVLRMVAAKLSSVGGGGQAFRYGGEEFLVVFRGRSAAEAEPFAEALRRSIEAVEFVIRAPDRPASKPHNTAPPNPNAVKTQISISIGIAERSKRHSTPDLVLDAADAALYRAKQAGRNCLKIAESTPS